MHFPRLKMQHLWLVVALYLSGCATTSTKTAQSGPTLKPSVLHQQHMDQITRIAQFSIKGRLGVVTKPKSFSARLAWQHRPNKDNIDVYSPIGGKVANIVKTPEHVILTDNGNKTTEAENVESLTEKTLGFQLPLSGLGHWALGRPSNTDIVNAITWDKHGRINHMQQSGWDIEYKTYTNNAGYFLPKKITLTNEKMTLKLIIEKWLDL